MNFINYCKDSLVYLRKKYYKRKLNKFINNVGICSTMFGMPGTGKTTICGFITDMCLKADYPIYSNVPLIGAIPFTKKDFGKYDMSNSIVLLDECSLFFDNRNFSDNFNEDSLSYLKLLRHRKTTLICFSQHLDIDIKLIRMSNTIFQIKRGIFSTSRMIKVDRKVGINEETHKFEDQYFERKGFLGFFGNKRIFRPLYYKYFDSYDAPKLPDLPNKETYKNKKGLDNWNKKNTGLGSIGE